MSLFFYGFHLSVFLGEEGGTEWLQDTSLGLMTGVLHNGQRSRESSSFTPQFTQYDIIDSNLL